MPGAKLTAAFRVVNKANTNKANCLTDRIDNKQRNEHTTTHYGECYKKIIQATILILNDHIRTENIIFKQA